MAVPHHDHAHLRVGEQPPELRPPAVHGRADPYRRPRPPRCPGRSPARSAARSACPDPRTDRGRRAARTPLHGQRAGSPGPRPGSYPTTGGVPAPRHGAVAVPAAGGLWVRPTSACPLGELRAKILAHTFDRGYSHSSGSSRGRARSGWHTGRAGGAGWAAAVPVRRDRGKSGLHRARCWPTASRGDPQDSATENRPPARVSGTARVKRCGKSAPAAG